MIHGTHQVTLSLHTAEIAVLREGRELARSTPRREPYGEGVMLRGDWPAGLTVDAVALALEPDGPLLMSFPIDPPAVTGHVDVAIRIPDSADSITVDLT